jgi:hypothetical protein
MSNGNFYKLLNDGTLGPQLPGVETVTASRTLTEAQNGTTFFLAAAAGFDLTLPAPKAGLRYSFIVATAPTSNGYKILSAGGDNIIDGLSVTSANASANLAAARDTITLVHNQAISGDRVDLISNGAKWYVLGFVSVVAAMTFAAT